MRHPKRTITRALRTRRPIHPGRERDELDAVTWPQSLRVADCMTRGVATIHSDALARGAAQMMRTRRIRHLPVVDREGGLVGIVTDRDLRQVLFDPVMQARAGHLAGALKAVTVRDVMTWAVLTVQPDTPLRDAARLMHERKVGALPVVAGGRVVGILSETDVLKAFAHALGQGFAKPDRWALAAR
ncbi:MAG: CBS domain-containing protein [Candidatus Rokubacteria bacterium]|nr:CBS domain-containing protein [Candidatus Rokubacteria bacterium]